MSLSLLVLRGRCHREESQMAGQKILLADDSAAIQKVVDLTFCDEGFEVATVSDGDQAVHMLGEFSPDIVLVNASLPLLDGYKLCQFIKQSERFRHIPVMLLVGSFEPFDEAEARRVGADDVVTKPFQSIRQLVSRVGSLLGGKPPESGPTGFSTLGLATAPLEREAPTPFETEPENSAAAMPEHGLPDIDITTADTLKLPQERPWTEDAGMHPPLPEHDYTAEPEPQEPAVDARHDLADETSGFPMEPTYEVSAVSSQDVSAAGSVPLAAAPAEFGDTVLDLGDLGDLDAAPVLHHTEDAILELDYAVAEPKATVATEAPPAFAESSPDVWSAESAASELIEQPPSAVDRAQPEPVTGRITLSDLSPEVIDAIARRAVEHLSDEVVREIAWEVVPELAELLIKRSLEH